MRTFILKTTAIILALAGLFSCSKDDSTNDEFNSVPEEVRIDFQKRFPSAKNIEWEIKANTIKADFYVENTEYEAYWTKDASWQWSRTEKDVDFVKNPLPAAIQNYLNTEYAGWKVDDVDLVHTSSDEFYEISLEMSGKPDTVIFIHSDGTLV